MNPEVEYQVVDAAGGNPTGVVCYDDASHRGEYASIAKRIMEKMTEIEQFGFLEGSNHLQMSGGEFCGNAARVAAFLISKRTGRTEGTFTISGFEGTVEYTVNGELVRCVFPHYRNERRVVHVLDVDATLVDLGGIVHIVLPPSVAFHNDPAYYRAKHAEVSSTLGLESRAAVGVIWQELRGEDTLIHPVVWVRDIDSFFYETSCGSGTLATILAANAERKNIFQPSGESILAEHQEGDTLALSSTIKFH